MPVRLDRFGAIDLALSALLLATPAAAQLPGRAATTPPPPALNNKLRSFTLRNLGTRAIVQASANMSNGETADITKAGRVMPNHAQSFGANNGGCLDSISVTFAGGAKLQAEKLAACDVTTIVVRDDKITADSSATPGAARPNLPSDQ